MEEGNRVVVRFKDGRLVKGHVRDFSIDADTIVLNEHETGRERRVPFDDLKAIYFVKTFSGFHQYVEKKAFGTRKIEGRKVFVKFNDKETLMGVIEGDIPWDKGFSLAKLGDKAKGFYIIPVDGDSNNDKVFVVGNAIEDVTIMVV